MANFILENWSRDYWLAPDIQVDTYPGDLALMDYEMFDSLCERTGGDRVLAQVDGIHYHFQPSDDVMGNRAAVPVANHRVTESPELLICK